MGIKSQIRQNVSLSAQPFFFSAFCVFPSLVSFFFRSYSYIDYYFSSILFSLYNRLITLILSDLNNEHCDNHPSSLTTQHFYVTTLPLVAYDTTASVAILCHVRYELKWKNQSVCIPFFFSEKKNHSCINNLQCMHACVASTRSLHRKMNRTAHKSMLPFVLLTESPITALESTLTAPPASLVSRPAGCSRLLSTSVV